MPAPPSGDTLACPDPPGSVFDGSVFDDPSLSVPALLDLLHEPGNDHPPGDDPDP